jgi:hypothetical protein
LIAAGLAATRPAMSNAAIGPLQVFARRPGSAVHLVAKTMAPDRRNTPHRRRWQGCAI